MGRKRNDAASRRKASAEAKYDQLTDLNDKIFQLSTQIPSAKDLESSCCSIWELTEQVRSLQTPADPTGTRSRESRLRAFMRWSTENGAKCDKVDLALFEGLGVGVQATQRIEPHEEFMSIPRSMMLTADTELSSIGELLRTDPIASQMPNIALSLHLLSERFKGSGSYWKPYLDVLPETYDTPLYFPPNEIALLKGSPTYEQSIHMQRNVARQYAYFWSLFINKRRGQYPVMAKNFTYDLYRWAVSTVMTRQNYIRISGSSVQAVEDDSMGHLTLIPLWDMCNHRQGEMLTDYDEAENKCHCYADGAYEPGNQVYICYGFRPNSDFFVHSGFVYPENPNNVVQLKLGLAKSDSLVALRKKTLTELGFGSEDIQVFHLKSGDEVLPDNLLTFLRVFHASEAALEEMMASKDPSKAIRKDNEQKSWSYLKVRCELLLRSYCSTLNDCNSQQLNAQHVTMIKQLVNEEKSIFYHMIKLCDDQLSASEEPL
ncbi:actin-histidine N-methyltransferase-like isoform X2 [Watersipora subatra]|uniref:actin-histidine N-methyltransferase-like isoform X2 n=1 Tax=Watersipora subatra TaxID=2589382 RepID=UPI00355B6E6F